MITINAYVFLIRLLIGQGSNPVRSPAKDKVTTEVAPDTHLACTLPIRSLPLSRTIEATQYVRDELSLTGNKSYEELRRLYLIIFLSKHIYTST